MPFPKGPRRFGKYLWGPRRAALGLSLGALSELAGVNRGDLSRFENGRLVPPAAAFEKVMAALEAATAGTGGADAAAALVAVNLNAAAAGEAPHSSPLGLPVPTPIE